MIKVFIVDDEDVIREGLIKHMPWEEHGCKVIGDACDATSALEFIENEIPDIVVTDICMNQLNGLAFSHILKQKYPFIHVIIISGYSDFEYAQRAIELKLDYFLVKPVDMEKLKEVVDAICLEIAEGVHQNKIKEQALEQMKLYQPLVAERFFQNLLSGRLEENEIEIYMNDKFGFMQSQKFLIARVQMDSSINSNWGKTAKDIQLVQFALNNILEEILDKKAKILAFVEKELYFVVLLNYTDSITYEELTGFLENFREYITYYVSNSCNIGVSREYDNLNETRKAVNQATSALSLWAKVDRGGTMCFQKDLQKDKLRLLENGDYENDIIFYLRQENCERVIVVIEDMRTLVETQLMQSDYILMIVRAVVNRMIIQLITYQIDIEEVGIGTYLELEQKWSLMVHTDELLDWLINLVKKYFQVLEEQTTAKSNYLAIAAKKYIDQNYCNSDLSLSVVATEIGISTAYLSTIFKSITGESYIVYLTNLRIEKAKKLLKESNMKTYEIAYEIGYENPHYFSINFKKTVGISPNQYRNGK